MVDYDTTTNETAKPKKGKTVTIKIPLTRKEHDDVYVAVNGKSFLIKRGEAVEVPDYVAEVLKRKEDMIAQAMAFEIEAASKQ